MIDFFGELYQENRISSILKMIENMKYTALPLPVIDYSPQKTIQQGTSKPSITSVKSLKNPSLISYLEKRGISQELAQLYYSEIHYQVHEKNYFAL